MNLIKELQPSLLVVIDAFVSVFSCFWINVVGAFVALTWCPSYCLVFFVEFQNRPVVLWHVCLVVPINETSPRLNYVCPTKLSQPMNSYKKKNLSKLFTTYIHHFVTKALDTYLPIIRHRIRNPDQTNLNQEPEMNTLLNSRNPVKKQKR